MQYIAVNKHSGSATLPMAEAGVGTGSNSRHYTIYSNGSFASLKIIDISFLPVFCSHALIAIAFSVFRVQRQSPTNSQRFVPLLRKTGTASA
jgi:hypothetical protein